MAHAILIPLMHITLRRCCHAAFGVSMPVWLAVARMTGGFAALGVVVLVVVWITNAEDL